MRSFVVCCVLGFASQAVAVPVVVEVTVDPLSPRDLDELQTVRFGYDTDAELLWDGVKDPLGIFGDDSPNLRHHYRGDWAEWVEPDGDLRRLTTDLEIQIANDFRSQGDYFRIKSTIENMELGITDDFATKGLITTLDLGEVTESLTLENAAGAAMQWGGSPHLSGLVTDMRITIVPEPSSITLAAFCSFVMCMVKRRIRPVAVCLLIAMAVTSRAVAVPVVMEVTVDSSFSETLTGLQTVYFGWDTDAELLWDGVKDPAGVVGDNPPNTIHVYRGDYVEWTSPEGERWQRTEGLEITIADNFFRKATCFYLSQQMERVLGSTLQTTLPRKD